MKKSEVTHIEPEVSLEQILAYEHDKPETHTSSRIVNLVCEKMFQDTVLTPDEVAARLNVERIKLTHTMELLTGYSLADIRVEMMVKRWRDYRKAHPNYKEKEIAEAMGYTNYNSYYRFMERNRSRFPELVSEDATTRGHVMALLEKLMPDEPIEVRRLYGLLPFRGGYAEAEACVRLLYHHGSRVADLASMILQHHPELNLSEEQVREAALLHNVGIVWTEKPEIHCHGIEPYSQHHALGSAFLEKHHNYRCAHVASNHTFFSSRSTDSLAQLVAYASCFISIFDLNRQRSVEEIRTMLSRQKGLALTQFDELHKKFRLK